MCCLFIEHKYIVKAENIFITCVAPCFLHKNICLITLYTDDYFLIIVGWLQRIDKASAATLIRQVLPRNWEGQTEVKLSPHADNITIEWFQILWDYLRATHPYDLSQFEGLHIVPKTSDEYAQLLPLSKTSPILLKSGHGSQLLNPEIQKILKLFGVHVLDEAPRYVTSHGYVMGTYIKDPRNQNIVDVLFLSFKYTRLGQKALDQLRQTSPAEKRSIIHVISGLQNYSEQDFLKKMCIFPSLQMSHGSNVFVSINEIQEGGNLAMFPFEIRCPLIDLSDPVTCAAASMLGVRVLTKKDILDRYILDFLVHGNITGDQIQKTMQHIFDNFREYSTDGNLLEKLRRIPFVECGLSKPKPPSDVCDPSDKILCKLYKGDLGMFPVGNSAKQEMLRYLREIGLKQSDALDVKDILGVMQAIKNSTKDNLMAKCQALLQVLNKQPHMLQKKVAGRKLQNYAESLPWVPVCSQKPSTFPKSAMWKTGMIMAKPSEVRPYDDLYLCGSICPLISGEVGDGIRKAFRWDHEPTVDMVIDQLEHVVQSYHPNEKSVYLTMINKIYQFLQKSEAENLKRLRDRKQFQTWVWYGDGFTSVESIFEEATSIDLRPHIHILPEDMTQFMDLFVGQGMKQTCSVERYVGVLHQLKQNEQEHAPNKKQSKRNLLQTIDILNHLKDHVNSLTEDLKSDIVVPTSVAMAGSRFKMVHVNECTFQDKDSIRHNVLNTQENIIFLHNDIPWTTAEALGVTPLIKRVLHVENFGFVGYGQTEALTSRLKNLLADYSDGLAIFKEMIQNADDAGATEVRFLFDERINKSDEAHLLDEGMKKCQGPALWVYNDGTFSDEDFDNIIKLGAGTKETKELKIGRFGLGFNSVYNITDVPSFVSQKHLAIFDPHRSHIGKCIQNGQPGIKVDISKNRQTIQMYPDQFGPYQNLYGCDIMSDGFQGYKGTLLRLPLRTKQQAVVSEISHLNYDRGEIISLLRLMIRNAPTLLLFTQHVKTMKVDHIPQVGGPENMTEIFTLDKELVENISHDNLADKSTSQMLAESLHYTRNSSSCSSPRSTWVTQVKYQTHKNTFDIVEQKCCEENWLISESCGIGTSLKLARKSNQSVPIGGVAMRLDKLNDQYLPLPLWNDDHYDGIAFCFLPLPITTDLPVHVNGALAIDSSRKHLSERVTGDKIQERAIWNEALLHDAVNRAYQQCVYDLREVISYSTDMELYPLWPTINVAGVFEHLSCAFYENQTSLVKLPFCTRNGKLLTLESVVFLDTIDMSSVVAASAIEMFEMCVDQHVLPPPAEVMKCLKRAKHGKLLAEKYYNMHRFFDEIFFPNISQMTNVCLRDELVVYAIEQNDHQLNTLLKKYECIPSTPKGKVLCNISSLVHPHGSAGRLFKPDDGRFPAGKPFNAPTILQLMTSLGMYENDLMWADVVNRAASVNDMMALGENEGKKRLDCFFRFLDAKLTSPQDSNEINEAQNALQIVEFLRIRSRNKFSSLPWAGDGCSQKSLFRACDIYSSKEQHLVSATMCIADDIQMSGKVKQFLGLHEKPVPPALVMKQLEHTQSVDPQALKPEQYRYFLEVVTAIYSFFEDHLHTHQTIPEALKDMSTRPCLLIDEHFVLPANVAFRFHGPSCNQYLQAAPEPYRVKYQKFLQALGVKENFDVQDFVNVLCSIHKKAKDNTLRKNQLKVCLSVLTLLNNAMEKQQLSVEDVVKKFGVIYVPNKKAILLSSTSLCYDDCPWIHRDNLDYTHESISYEVSCRLGIKTKKEQTVRRNAIGIPFGQQEKLTTSIQRILKTYPRDHQILKELIQNADDAGATEIHFVRDGRTHGKERIFHESWEPLQGPALCVYNNRPFTTADLEGIQRLGEGSKRDDPCKTGQYGIGFSSVYHLTDVPSILTSTDETGQTLCVFDPNCQYVQEATPAVPGVRYNLEDLAEFSDVTSCYHKDQFDLVNGSMFRLPLRTDEMANKSHLSAEGAIKMDNISEILESLKIELFDILLFTNNLEEIKISDINQTTGKLENTYAIRIRKTEELQRGRPAVFEAVRNCGTILQSGQALETVPRQEFLYKLNIEDNCERNQIWCVSQIIGFLENTEIPSGVKEAFVRDDLVLLPRGGCAMRLDERYVQSNKKAFCFMPLPDKTNLPLHINGHFALGHENRGFVWGKSKAGSYKEEWNDLLCSSIIADCYVNIMEHHKRETVELLNNTNLKQPITSLLDRYQSLFPSCIRTSGDWQRLVKGVYKCLVRRQSELFPIHITNEYIGDNKEVELHVPKLRWVSVGGSCKENAFFSKSEYILNPKICASDVAGTLKKPPLESAKLQDTLLNIGMHVVRNSLELGRDLETSEVLVNYVTPETTNSFLMATDTDGSVCNLKHSLPLFLHESPIKTQEMFFNLLDFCRKDDGFIDKLEGLPLLLTKDSVLRIFNKEQPVFTPKHCARLLHKRLDKTVTTRFYQALSIPDKTQCPFVLDPTIEDIAEILPDELPARYCEGQVVELNEKECFEWAEWLRHFWDFLVCCTNNQACTDVQTDRGSLELRKEKGESTINELVDYKQILKPMNNISFVPCKTNKKICFFPFSQAKDVLYIEQNVGTTLKNILEKFGVPELLVNAFYPGYQSAYTLSRINLGKSLLTSTNETSNLLVLLHNHRRDNLVLTEPQAKCIRKHFVDNLQILEKAGTVDLLRDLPIHVTVSGQIISLSDMTAVYSVSSDVPMEGMDYWHSTESMAFLKEEAELKRLHELLDCKSMGTIDIYCDCILKHLELFEAHHMLIHLHFLYTQYLNKGEKIDMEIMKLISALKEVCIFEGDDHIVQCASEFCDPKCKLFLEMLPDDQFPPMLKTEEGNVSLMTRWTREQWLTFCASTDESRAEGWSNKDWLIFLRKIGLVEHPTPDRLVNFAQQVKKDADRCDLEHVTRRAKTIIKELYEMKEENISIPWCDIRSISFIPQAEVSAELHAIHPQCGARHGNKVSLIPFQGSIGDEHENLVWTCMTILPSWSLPCHSLDMDERDTKSCMQQLGISSEPNVRQVLNHVKNIVHSINTGNDQTEERLMMVGDIFRNIYGYFSHHDINTFCELANEPIVLVLGRQTLVKACQTVVNLSSTKEIKPYLYKIPSQLGEFVPLFEKLGATESPTIHQYVSVLEYIKVESGETRPRPDKLDAMFRAIEEIFNSGEDLDELNSLYLPNENGLLTKTKSLICNDVPGFRQRLGIVAEQIPLMADLLEANVGHNRASDVVSCLPDIIKPRMLSSVVYEELCESTSHNIGPGSIATVLEERLRSEEFLDAVKRLIYHESWKAGDNLANQAVVALVSRIDKVRVRGRDGLRTRLMLTDQAIPGSEKEQLCFLRKPRTEDNNWTLYVCNDETKKSQIMIMFGNDLNKIVDDRLRSCVTYLPILFSCPVEDIDDLLTAYNISKVQSVASMPVSRVALRPRIGGLVPEHTHTQLMTGGSIEEGCLVVYQVGEAKMYVRVLKIEGHSVSIDVGRNKQTVNYHTLMTFTN